MKLSLRVYILIGFVVFKTGGEASLVSAYRSKLPKKYKDIILKNG